MDGKEFNNYLLSSNTTSFPLSLPCVKLSDKGKFDESFDLDNYYPNQGINSFFVQICGNDYSKFGIENKHVLFIHSQEQIVNRDYVLVQIANRLSVKQYREIDEIKYLVTPTGIFLPLEINPYIKYKIIGVAHNIMAIPQV